MNSAPSNRSSDTGSKVGLGVSIEGQEGLDWRRWRLLCELTDSLGFDSLWRSDHLMSVLGAPQRECLEAWTSLALAAEWTHNVEFGPLVTPIMFRAPALLARMACSVDVLSRGRLILGLGAGWNQQEHEVFGLRFRSSSARLTELEQGIIEIRRVHRDFNPKPARNPLPILIGGSGKRLSLGVAARCADEYNADGMTPSEFTAFSQRLSTMCKEAGRPADAVRRSVTLSVLVAGTQRELSAKAGQLAGVMPDFAGMSPDDVVQKLRNQAPGPWVVGTPAEVSAQLAEYVPLGVSRLILEIWLLDDVEDTLNLLGHQVAPTLVGRGPIRR